MKRRQLHEETSEVSKKNRDVNFDGMEDAQPLGEDVFGDVFEEEEIIAGTMDDEADQAAAMEQLKRESGETPQVEQNVWLPGINSLEENEVLDFDPSAYSLYHKMKVEWPCLSFNILPDSLGNWRTVTKPATVYAVAGSQAEKYDQNQISVLKMTNLSRMEQEDDDDGGFDLENDDDDDDDDDADPMVYARSFKHPGGVNRLKTCPQRSEIVASWSDTGKVYAWDISPYAQALEKGETITDLYQPLYTFAGHTQEGYALDWSVAGAPRLASGSCDGTIFVHALKESSMAQDGAVMASHTASVEDIQWSPSEPQVFASCSVDRTIRIWDTRQRSRPAITVHAHDSDVNVLSWNRKTSYLLASGADDGSLKIWDLRRFNPSNNKPAPSALFQWHKQPITSIEWHPQEDSVLACSSEDNSVTVWDMALEADPEEVAKEATGARIDYNIPPQLLFIHLGQEHIKEIHFHPQIPSVIMSTALDGIDIFKAANLDVILPPSVDGSS